MSSPDTVPLYQRWSNFLTNPGNRRLHLLLITGALLSHLALHYATYYPPLRDAVSKLPYFRLHALHEAEFLVIIVYAGLVFRLKGGLTAIAVTATTSLPFLLTPFIFGRQPRTDELRDLAIQVGLILVMGIVITLLQEVVARERDRRTNLSLQLEEANGQLSSRAAELEQLNQRVSAANRQLAALNEAMQTRLNTLFGDLGEMVEEQERQLPNEGPVLPRERLSQFVGRVARVIRRP